MSQKITMQVNIHSKPQIDKNMQRETDGDINAPVEKCEDVFPEASRPGIAPNRNVEIAIFRECVKTKTSLIYKLVISEVTEKAKSFAKGFIWPNIATSKIIILCIKNMDGSLTMSINYRALNKLSIRNHVSFFRIDNVWDQMSGAKYFLTIKKKNIISSSPNKKSRPLKNQLLRQVMVNLSSCWLQYQGCSGTV